MRKWLPAMLIGLGFAVSAATFGELPPHVRFPAELLLPPGLAGEAGTIPRLLAAFGLPTLALALWALLFEAPEGPLGRLGLHLFPGSSPPRYQVFAPSYRLIVIWVVSLPLSLHVVLLGNALGWTVGGGRLVGLTFGGGLMLAGNLFPRLRPNPIAGIRTSRTLSDPVLWARVQRAFGALWLLAGALTTLVAIVSPPYALATGIVTLALSALRGVFILRSMAVAFAACAIVLSAACYDDPTGPYAGPPAQTLPEFEAQLDRLREDLAIPGMAAIVMVHESVVWEGSLGLADVPSQRPVTPTTQFHLASLTKTFASTIVLQLVEEGLVGLDDPVSDYGIALPGADAIHVRHLLSHTSEGTPGEEFRYNGDRYALLDQVILQATGESFAERVTERIVMPLGLDGTAPNPLDPVAFAASGKVAATYIAAMASGYGVDGQGRPAPVAYPALFSSAAGLVSTARDVARYSTALDAGQFLGAATRTLAYTPARGAGGRVLPHGLGWFVSTVDGHTLVWHYGYWTGNSSLIIKEPSRGLTFVALTNSDQLSARYSLGAGDLMSSAVAQAFVNAFVTGSLGDGP